MMTDPIADMLTRIRNAHAARKHSVDIPYAKMKFALAGLLAREGYVGSIVVAENKLSFRVHLRYDDKGRSAIRSLDRVSTPGRRVYIPKDKIPTVLSGYGIAVVSTSRGLLTNKEAKKLGIGGEYICTIA